MTWTEIAARLHFSAGNMLIVGGGTLLMSMTCLFCWFRGAKPDRIGAVVFATFWLVDIAGAWIHLWVTGDQRPPLLTDAICNVAPGLAFLWLALRYDNLWFGVVAAFQGLQYAMDAADRAIHEPLGGFLPVVLILGGDLLNLVMMAAMVGSVLSRRGRRPDLGAGLAKVVRDVV